MNKTEKSTNGTDSRWSNPKSRGEKVYCTTLTGYNRLKEDRQDILSDLALSDYNLQDAIVGADSIEVADRDVNGQTYVDYDLYGFFRRHLRIHHGLRRSPLRRLLGRPRHPRGD